MLAYVIIYNIVLRIYIIIIRSAVAKQACHSDLESWRYKSRGARPGPPLYRQGESRLRKGSEFSDWLTHPLGDGEWEAIGPHRRRFHIAW